MTFSTETKMQTWFGKNVSRFVDSGLIGCGVYELKLVKRDNGSLYRSELKEHQMFELMKACDGRGVYHKISDSALGYKPLDCFYTREGGWLVVGFNHAHEVWAVWGAVAARWYTENKKGSISYEWIRKHGQKVV